MSMHVSSYQHENVEESTPVKSTIKPALTTMPSCDLNPVLSA